MVLFYDNYLITILQLTSGYRFTTEDVRLTPRTSIQFQSHRNMGPPATWNKSNKSCIEQWIERSSLNSISIIVAWERLQKSKSQGSVLYHLIKSNVNSKWFEPRSISSSDSLIVTLRQPERNGHFQRRQFFSELPS